MNALIAAISVERILYKRKKLVMPSLSLEFWKIYIIGIKKKKDSDSDFS